MSSRSALELDSHALRKKGATAPSAGVQSTVPVEAAANDDKPTTGFSVFSDPLFGMAIATGIVFAALAALVALT
jgi:hypothetical protein